MKTLVIGDLHGLNVWKKLIKEHSPEMVIFLGDYVDSFIAPDSDIVQNLRDIIEYKRTHRDKCILLLGNHDIQYIYEGNNCSGRRSSYAGVLKSIFEQRISLFQVCYERDGFLFSHAGFTKEWEEMIYEAVKGEFIWENYNSYNKLLHTRWRDLLFTVGASRGGKDKYSGPLWADKEETTERGRLRNYKQIVGHTKVHTLTILPHIVYCDNLEYGDGIPLILDIK